MHSCIQALLKLLPHRDPTWAVGTAGNSVNIKPRSQGWISRGKIPVALQKEETKKAHPTRPRPARCFSRCGQPKQGWAEGERTGAQRAIVGALKSQEQIGSKRQYLWIGDKSYANELQPYANDYNPMQIVNLQFQSKATLGNHPQQGW